MPGLNNKPKNGKRKMQVRKRKATPMPQPRRPLLSTTTPTLQQVQASQRKSIGGQRSLMTRAYSSPYMHCRMNPYTSKGGTAIPDGQSNKFIVVDHFVADNITTLTTAGFTIQTYPFLPYTAGISGNAFGAIDISVNGQSVRTPTILQGGLNVGLWPIGRPTELTSSLQLPGVQSPDVYLATKARIVSMTRRLIYLSPSQTATGVISVTPRSIGITVGQPTTATGLNFAANELKLFVNDALNTNSTPAPANTNIYSVDTGAAVNISQFTRDTVTTRVENGIVIRGKTNNSTHLHHPVHDTTFGVVQNQRLSASSTGTIVSNLFSSESDIGGIIFADDSWQSQVITVTGAIVGAQFRLETVICVEYILGGSSPYAPLSRSAVPAQPSVVTSVDAAINALPVAVPGTSEPR